MILADVKTVGDAKRFLAEWGGTLVDNNGNTWTLNDKGQLVASWSTTPDPWRDDYSPVASCPGDPYWSRYKPLESPPALKTEAQPDPLPITAPAVTKHQARKNQPACRGFAFYFPDAMMAAGELSRVGNEQHNAGQPMHWAYSKSADHGDCILRHQLDYDELDDDGILHATKVLWRAAAQLQTLLEKQDPELHARRQAQRERQSRGER